MTQDKPYLFLNRLIIISYTGAIAYDEKFHKGVNIIRGKNSSGKSTISNFIFFALGGDYNNWNSESLKCQEVFAEVEINKAIYTLRRSVTTSLRQPMSIYWGDYENSRLDGVNWKTFSYQQTEERLSFTNILFSALNFPEVKSENDSNITLHQILRLLYIDQDSPTQCLFRREIFDQPQTRQAISEVLLGIYDDDLYGNRLQLRKANKDYDEKKREFDHLSKAYIKSGNATTIEALNKEIENERIELERIQTEIVRTKEAATIRVAINSATRVERIQKELIPVKQHLKDLMNQIYQLDLDSIDSKNFIETLEKRIVDLENSILTRKILGEISLDHCPNCLNPLENHIPNGHCFLCKQPLTDSEERTHAKRLMQELQLQVKESRGLLILKEKQLVELRGDLPKWKEKTVALQKELDTAISESQSTRDDKLDELFSKKGGIEKQIEHLALQLKGIELLDQLKKELADLSSLIEKLELTIRQQETKQQQNKDYAILDIEKKTVFILRNDLDRQGEFKTASSVTIDFYGDAIALNDNFNFSASSNTYLKNAVRFAIFFASLNVDFMRYPKFILCDNMEDKGMEKERTQNLQKLLTTISETFKDKVEHQIIFSTSMIADELEGSVYCIGDYYDQNKKTLRV
ncbi:MAG TPA: AAA family ATPase [Cyclobacteriaceae bacterium]|jgi:DNA repair exonuclease SbcCD ATPase subunit|nr:AAA family ATPase [Cyclobacteriaceae bacterium]